MLKAKIILRLAACSITLSTFAPSIAFGQSGEKCSLDQISNALNQLDCEVNGAYVSPDSVAKGLSDECDRTQNSFECHTCFMVGGHRLAESFYPLVRLKILPPTAPAELLGAIQQAEESTCSSKPDPIAPPQWGDDPDDGDDDPPSDSPDEPDQNLGRPPQQAPSNLKGKHGAGRGLSNRRGKASKGAHARSAKTNNKRKAHTKKAR